MIWAWPELRADLYSRRKALMAINASQTSLICTALVTVFAAAAHAQEAAAPPPTVTVRDVASADFTIAAKLPGRIKASTEAEIRPQVSGIIKERFFDEGATVKAGQPLYKIDDVTYVAAVNSARATVAEAQADYDLAVIEANRAQGLFEGQSGSASNRDKAVGQRNKADAVLKSAKAKLTSAEIDQERTTIRASIDGVIGFSQTTPGALVAAQQTTALTTIRTLDPVYVDVTQSATELLAWNRPEGKPPENQQTAALILPDGSGYDSKGDLRAAEPKVEPTTGMVTLRVSFANPSKKLLPGLYVEVELPQKTIANAIRVPQSAVMRKPDGSAYVWIVENGKVSERAVEVAVAAGNEWVTTTGLRTGDRVITSGFQKIKPGAPVTLASNAPKDQQTAPKEGK